MPQPTIQDVHVNRPLSDLSIAFMQEFESVVPAASPKILVTNKSDSYYTYPRDNWNRANVPKRAPGDVAAEDGWTLTTDSYLVDVYAMRHLIPDQIRANQDAPLDQDRDATEFVTRKLMLQREVDWAANLFTTGVWGTDVTPGNKWDDFALGTPLADLLTARTVLKRQTGFRPNTLILTELVWEALIQHPDFLDRIVGGSTKQNAALVMPELLAQILGLQKVVIADSVQNIAAEGAAENMQFIFGDAALMLYVEPRPGLMKPSASYSFVWNYNGSGGVEVRTYREEARKGDWVEAETNWDHKVVAPEMGYFFNDVLA